MLEIEKLSKGEAQVRNEVERLRAQATCGALAQGEVNASKVRVITVTIHSLICQRHRTYFNFARMGC